MEFGTGIRNWNSELEFGTGIQNWNSELEFGIGIFNSKTSLYAIMMGFCQPSKKKLDKKFKLN